MPNGSVKDFESYVYKHLETNEKEHGELMGILLETRTLTRLVMAAVGLIYVTAFGMLAYFIQSRVCQVDTEQSNALCNIVEVAKGVSYEECN